MFTAATLAAFLVTNQCVPPKLVDTMVAVALNENPHLDPNAINHNTNGTYDYGLAQVNTINLSWTGLTPVTAMDPCKNIAAAAKVLFAKYNGNAPVRRKIAYTNGFLLDLRQWKPIPRPSKSRPARPQVGMESMQSRGVRSIFGRVWLTGRG